MKNLNHNYSVSEYCGELLKKIMNKLKTYKCIRNQRLSTSYCLYLSGIQGEEAISAESNLLLMQLNFPLEDL